MTAFRASLLVAFALSSGGREGPYDMVLLPGPRVPGASGTARLAFVDSPFGVAVTDDGRHVYQLRITTHALPDPATLGPFHAYVAWAVLPDLSTWRRLGVVRNGVGTVGPVDWNKFLLVITAEAGAGTKTHTGPTVLHGTSPSGWLQTFLTHPLFRGISQ